MTQYKTVAGPIELRADGENRNEVAVRKYASIIDAEAVGGWYLHSIQQISVTKLVTNQNAVAACGFAGMVIGGLFGFDPRGPSGELFLFAVIGAAIGGGLAYAFAKNPVIEFFNMLVFEKKE